MIVQNSREEKNRPLIVLIVRLNMFISFITKPFFMTMIMDVLHCHWKKYYYPRLDFFSTQTRSKCLLPDYVNASS